MEKIEIAEGISVLLQENGALLVDTGEVTKERKVSVFGDVKYNKELEITLKEFKP